MSRRLAVSLLVLFLCVVCFVGNATEKRAWTLAVYIAGDNNLDQFGVEDIRQMAQVGSNESLHIVTLIDRFRAPAQLKYVEKDNVIVLEELGEIDSGDYREFVKFVRFVKDNYPAHNYAIVIWNHGTGWRFLRRPVHRGIAYDYSSNNHITNEQLGIAMAQVKEIIGRKIEVFVMDACLMQMVEVIHAVKDTCKYVVASQELEPGEGAPYHDILAEVTCDMTPLEFANNWVYKFAKSFDGGSQGFDISTQSSIDTSKFDDLVNSLNGFAKAVMSGRYVRDVRAVLQRVQNFDYRENIDLVHFAQLLGTRLEHDSSLRRSADRVVEAAKAAITANATSGPSVDNANGIAIYLPANFILDAKYSELCFSQATLWDDMIVHLQRQAMIAAVVDDLRNGSLATMRTFTEHVKSNSSDRRFVRFVLRELNQKVYGQDDVLSPATSSEFDALFEQIKSLI